VIARMDKNASNCKGLCVPIRLVIGAPVGCDGLSRT
jgi:hypothetical protein